MLAQLYITLRNYSAPHTPKAGAGRKPFRAVVTGSHNVTRTHTHTLTHTHTKHCIHTHFVKAFRFLLEWKSLAPFISFHVEVKASKRSNLEEGYSYFSRAFLFWLASIWLFWFRSFKTRFQ
jgi:hypothetical protein